MRWESRIVGPWTMLAGSWEGSTAADGKPGPEIGALRFAMQVPFLLAMAVVLLLWLPQPPPGFFGRLAGLFAVALALLASSMRIRAAWFDRALFFSQVLLLDQFYKLLMSHGSHLPAYWDRFFLELDARLFGSWPIDLGRVTSTAQVEYWAFVYSMFILYLFSSLFLSCFARERRVAASFFLGVGTLYAISYVGYVLWPTQGPKVLPLYDAPLPGGYWFGLLEQSLKSADAYCGAFPSLHTGAVVFILGFDFLHSRRRFWAYLPLGLSIIASTLTLRQHYLIDLVAGAALALAALRLGEWALAGGSSRDLSHAWHSSTPP